MSRAKGKAQAKNVNPVNGNNPKGECGSVKIETIIGGKGDRVIDLDGMKFQIGQGVAEELLAALTSSLRPFAGYSIFDKVMLELDAVMDRLAAREPSEDGRDPGRAEAYTTVLAIIRSPYEPDYKGEKDRQMERWHKRNEEGHTG